MVYTEQVRQLASEQNFIDVATAYTRNNAAWGTIHEYGNITLSEDSLIVFTFVIGLTQSAYRLKIGSYYAHGCYVAGTYTGLAFVAAGTHMVKMEQKNVGADTGHISNFQLGKAKFSDTKNSNLAAYSVPISLTIAQRSPPSFFGTLKNAIWAIMVWAYTPGAQTNFENVGDVSVNGVAVAFDFFDGDQQNWTVRIQDTGSNETAYAYCFQSKTVGLPHTITITKRNAATVVHISIFACPWLLAGIDNEPMTLNFSQGSTLYLVFEPLNADPTKNSYIGKVRAVSYGDTTDFYSTASGTGILAHTYTFELVDATSVTVIVNGLGGCISLIGLDER